MSNSFYEEFTHNGTLYSVDCELLKDGEYEYVPPSSDDSGGHDIIEEPEFCNFIYGDLDENKNMELDNVPSEVSDLALIMLNEKYWEELLDG